MYVFFIVVGKYFIDNFKIYANKGYWPINLFCAVVVYLFGFDTEVIQMLFIRRIWKVSSLFYYGTV